MFFEIRKQKYLEAHDRHLTVLFCVLTFLSDKSQALKVLMEDLMPFKETNTKVWTELLELLTYSNFRLLFMNLFSDLLQATSSFSRYYNGRSTTCLSCLAGTCHLREYSVMNVL